MVPGTPTQNIFAAVDPDLWSPTATTAAAGGFPGASQNCPTDTDFIGPTS